MFRSFALLLVVVALAGCGKKKVELPPAYPVSGTIKYSDGVPFKGGEVHFASTHQEIAAQAFGSIGQDGSFSLVFIHANQRIEGAQAGEYRVTISPDQSSGQSGAVPYQLPKFVVVKEEDNVLPLVLPFPSR